ncbi:hypothetical protein TWF506_007256 [Arthrobotrys conoides]|uniref:Uncharacterized protein n=1 Tax=Arthrobotrys conoides TaxID=74498 RepID=A0AAN8NNU6_9PEZI
MSTSGEQSNVRLACGSCDFSLADIDKDTIPSHSPSSSVDNYRGSDEETEQEPRGPLNLSTETKAPKEKGVIAADKKQIENQSTSSRPGAEAEARNFKEGTKQVERKQSEDQSTITGSGVTPRQKSTLSVGS